MQRTKAVYLRVLLPYIAFHLTLLVATHGFSQTSPSPPGVTLDLADNAALAHLQRVDALLEAQEWRDAVDAIRVVMESAEGKVIAAGPERIDGFRRFIPLREHCQIQLSSFANRAPLALDHYRSIVDSRALRALKLAIAARDPDQLADVISSFFVSSATDQALLQLGDLEVERGHWVAARRSIERLAASARFITEAGESKHFDGLPVWLLTRHFREDTQWQAAATRLTEGARQTNWFVYPDSKIDRSAVQARLVLISILAGEPVRARLELELLKRIAPNSEGQLAGHVGAYVMILQELLEQSETWPQAASDANWPTFASSANRQTHAHAEPKLVTMPSWRTRLPLRSGVDDDRSREGQRVAESVDALLSYHPVAVGDRILVQAGAEPSDVVCYSRSDGGVQFGAIASNDTTEDVAANSDHGTRFTLTVDGSIVFAEVDSGDEDRGPSRLVGFDVERDGKLVFDLRLDGAPWNDHWSFDGTPLINGGYLYVTLRHRDEVGSQIHVACFDAWRADLLWRRKVCGGEWQETPAQTLLTLSEDTIYCNTHLGVIAALQARDGRVRWITEYPRVSSENDHPDRNTQHMFRDLTPCLVHHDLVIAAPADCDRLFALDANTGHVVWTTPPERAADAIHLLGVGSGNLIVSGDYLYWLDVYSGEIVGQFPPPRAVAPGLARPSPRGYGRGLLVGENVYWPTRESIFVFRQRTARIGRHPPIDREIALAAHGATGGNLIVAGNVLVIAAADELIVFDEYGQRTTNVE